MQRSSDPGTFDCILMDLMMPVMSGYEAARVIRSLERSDAKAVPIIALSANAFEEDIAMAKDAGMNEHLAKPVDIRTMLQVMSRMRCWGGVVIAPDKYVNTVSGSKYRCLI